MFAEKSKILCYPYKDGPSELIAKCHHATNIYFAITGITTENVSKNHRTLPKEVLEDWFP